MKRLPFAGLVTALSLALALPAYAQLGGLLDRAKRRAEQQAEPARNVREMRRRAEEAADVEGRVDAEVARERAEVEQAVPTEDRIERRAVDEMESTAAGRAVRDAQQEVERVQTTDERAEAAVRAEMRQTEAEMRQIEADAQRAIDLESRAREEAEQTDAARSVRAAEGQARQIGRETRETEREIRHIGGTGERAEAEVRGDVDAIQRSLQDATDFGSR